VKNTREISLYCLKNAPRLIQSHLNQQTDRLYYGDIKRPLLCWRHNCSAELMVPREQAGDEESSNLLKDISAVRAQLRYDPGMPDPNPELPSTCCFA